MRSLAISLGLVTLLSVPASWASPAPEVAPDDDAPAADEPADGETYRVPTVLIPYAPGDIFKVGGSAHLVEAERLEELEYDDPGALLALVPGVYVRHEDAYGLRPNIGLRGASSDRSKKVTLMEDGILFAPAPYAAPAAYYFPVMTRMVSTEVFKGPASILYGPNTIGGAINLISRDIPQFRSAGEIDLALGRFEHVKAHGHWGWGHPWGGFLIEAVHIHDGGFKELDGGGDTGFDRSEVVAKGRLNSDPNADVYHQADVKLAWSREVSNETYLGLSDADFEANPYRRYASSALGLMEADRLSGQLAYSLVVGDALDLTVTLYRHDFERDWRKLNRFKDGPSIADILAEPTSGQRNVFYRVLTGAEDSSTEGETLMIGSNDRHYVSAGAQVDIAIAAETGAIEHESKLGVRVHDDEVRRHHSEEGYQMRAGQLVRDGDDRLVTADSTARARAFAAWYRHALRYEALTLTPGVRFEFVETSLHDHLRGVVQPAGAQSVSLLGMGAHYALTPELAVIMGINQGFSPVSPGQPDAVEPEESVNYELGGRWVTEDNVSQVELFGFYNDYSNLTSECSFSSGCGSDLLDRQFNAGEVDVFGVELTAAYRFAVAAGLELPVRLAYTFTHARFATSFTSDNPLFGEVSDGDELPYVPEHQGSLEVGISHVDWGASVVGTWVGAMREQAGSDGDGSSTTDASAFVDLTGHYRPLPWLKVYLRVENLLMAEPIVSRRPLGARPGKPLLVQAGAKASF